jgi:pyruvate dehydrogenase E1 component alpha subunit
MEHDVPLRSFPSGNLQLKNDDLVELFRKMLELRRFEERVQKLHDQGKTVRPIHLYLGEEAIAVGVIRALDAKDQLVVTHRGHGHALARGVPMRQVMGEILGRSYGTCRGIGGSMHAAISVEHGIPVATAIVGSGIPIADGIAFALRYKGSNNIAATFFGDGATNTGASHEGLNLAGVWKLPVLFVCENNLYGQFTPYRAVFSGESITSRVSGYGIRSVQVFGNSVLEVYSAARDAISYIRNEKRPAFIECLTYRMRGHAAFDDAWYRPKEEVEEWLKKDPLELYANELRSKGLIDKDKIERMEATLQKELDQVVEEALSAVSAPFDELPGLVYASGGSS